jgi:hypothetical protein
MTGLSPPRAGREVAHEVLDSGIELREQACLRVQLVGVCVEAAEHDSMSRVGIGARSHWGTIALLAVS